MTTRREGGLASWRRQCLLLVAITAIGGCNATPLPLPPTAVPDRMSLVQSAPDEITLTGRSGAISPGNSSLRVTARAGFIETTVEANGAFSAILVGSRSELLFLEVLLDREDAFVVAVTGSTADTVAVTSPGPDRDGDRSPDAVDCAPNDATLGGRRCGADGGMCDPTPEICDGEDNNCDGIVDNGCPACVMDGDCPATQVCVGGTCSCAIGRALCMSVCADLSTDAANCGACGAACAAGESCAGSVCL